MGSDAERQMKLGSLARCSPPDGQSGSYQTVDCYRSAAGGLGTPALADGRPRLRSSKGRVRHETMVQVVWER